MALEKAGFQVAFANDNDPSKRALYELNFPPDAYVLEDIRSIRGDRVPSVDMATASFPCTDLSLAGNRLGLRGSESSTLWEFTRVVDEMGSRRPDILVLENVVGFATSHGGSDFRATLERLNELGYACDVLVIDARHFVPQSRSRLFIVALHEAPARRPVEPSQVRPRWLSRFAEAHPHLDLHAHPLPPLPDPRATLSDVVEQLPYRDERWWGLERMAAFVSGLSDLQRERLEGALRAPSVTYRTAYRRTRGGRAAWEIRQDEIAGCLRTTRGGSSKQALVQVGRGTLRLRWLTPREYARLQGAGDFQIDGVRDSQAYFAFGDAVCVPVVAWLAENYLYPWLTGGSREA
jgi:DNA (cytosine-5)-methyltransferase 1